MTLWPLEKQNTDDTNSVSAFKSFSINKWECQKELKISSSTSSSSHSLDTHKCTEISTQWRFKTVVCAAALRLKDIFTCGNQKVHWQYTSLPEDKAIVRFFLSPKIHMQHSGLSGVTSKNPLCFCFKILATKRQTLASRQNSKCFVLPTSRGVTCVLLIVLVSGGCY